MEDPFDLERFVAAQQGVFGSALDELRRGKKEGHWIWFIFPQIAGLGVSATSQKYGIKSLQEAEAYLRHAVLGPRLKECTQAVVDLTDATAESIFGELDAMKFRSSMTLFSQVVFADHVYRQAIEKHFGGQLDMRTLDRIG